MSFFNLFKEHLDKEKAEDDLDLLGNFAKNHYGWKPRITVKTENQIDFAFLFDDKDAPVDHLLGTPKGSAKDFTNFCNMH